MTLKIRNTRDLKHFWGRFMFYGDPDTFKTRCAATFPKPLFLAADTEGGILSVKDLGVDYTSVHDPSDAIEAMEDLHELNDRGRLKYKTMITDSLTILQENQIEGLIEGRIDREQKKRREKGRADWRVARDQPLNLVDADWGAVTSALRAMIVSAHSLPMHIIWICLCDRDYVQEGRERYMDSGFPMLYTRNASRKMAGVCDYIWYFEKREIKNKDPIRRVHTETWQRYIARSRTKVSATLKPRYKAFAKELGFAKPKRK